MPENELQHGASPYLLQHQENPAHWMAWGDAAFARAKAENKPILLPVGYAACHWCHVMAHESFEDEEISAVMNDLVINIKVDREERPGIDTIYQSALAMIGEKGGWPLTMFWTPDGEPFWGGTYFPPTPRYGRPGFPDGVKAVAETFKAYPDCVQKNVEALREGLADNIVRTFAGEPTRNFFPLSTLINSSELLRRGQQIVIIGDRDDAETQALVNCVQSRSLPDRILNVIATPDDLPAGHPIEGKEKLEARATAYVCERPVCSLPVNTAADLTALLDGGP